MKFLKAAIFLILMMLAALSLMALAVRPQAGTGWSKPVDLSEGATKNVHSYGVMVCDKYQNLHFFWGDNAPEGGAIYYRNDTWTKPKDIILINQPSIFNPSVVIDPKTDIVHLTWVTSQSYGYLYYAQAPLSQLADSRAWEPLQVLDQGVVNSVIDQDSQGRLHMVYAIGEPEGLSFDIVHILSTDDGQTWSDPVIIYSRTRVEPFTIFTSMDIDGSDRLHLGLTIRSQLYGNYSEVGYLRSLDNGKTWASYLRMSIQNKESPNIALIGVYAFGKNEIHLTWHDPRRMHDWSDDGGATFHGPDEIMPLGGAFGGFNQLVLDAKGIIHSVIAIADRVYSVAWSDGKWGKPELVDDRWIDPHGQHIAICQGNRLRVIYYDRIGDNTEWYSERALDAPFLSRRVIPTIVPTAGARTKQTPGEFSASLNGQFTPTPPVIISKEPTKTMSLQTVILAGTVPAILIIVAFAIFRKFSLRR